MKSSFPLNTPNSARFRTAKNLLTSTSCCTGARSRRYLSRLGSNVLQTFVTAWAALCRFYLLILVGAHGGSAFCCVGTRAVLGTCRIAAMAMYLGVCTMDMFPEYNKMLVFNPRLYRPFIYYKIHTCRRRVLRRIMDQVQRPPAKTTNAG